jgi:hypothetical protein
MVIITHLGRGYMNMPSMTVSPSRQCILSGTAFRLVVCCSGCLQPAVVLQQQGSSTSTAASDHRSTVPHELHSDLVCQGVDAMA